MLLEATAAAAVEQDAEHARFIDSLIERKLVLLGGEFGAPVAGAEAAYLLRCEGLEQAAAIAAEDPLVAAGAVAPRLVEWRLVGIDPDAIEPAVRV